MVKLSDDLIKETNLKEAKYFVIQEDYTHNFKRPALTLKFYSKYEANIEDSNTDILDQIREKYQFGPREKYPYPITTSQEYGWYPRYTETDFRFHFGRVIAPHTKIMQEFKKYNKNEQKFTGIPFLLQ